MGILTLTNSISKEKIEQSYKWSFLTNVISQIEVKLL